MELQHLAPANMIWKSYFVTTPKGNVQAVNYFVAQKYVDALQNLASADNNKVILMPLESSAVIGALGGIAELTQKAFAKKDG